MSPEVVTPEMLSEVKTVADMAQFNLNVVWTLIAGILVFVMQAGFALVEAGLTRAKNSCNIMMKNIFDFVMGSIAYFFIGYALMFGTSAGGFIGTDGFFMTVAPVDGHAAGSEWQWTYMFFQTMFAATSATIVSGAMAERTKFKAYLLYSVLVSLFIYPISGHWSWGGGWLSEFGFVDFAGSTVVHSVGGWLALAGAIMLGPRIGKYRPDGKPNAIPGHNMVLCALGVLLLWIGWFGFNPGSTVDGNGSIGRIAMTTNLGAVGAALTAMITSWILFKKPDLSMSLNGALAGLVAITAGCATTTLMGALIIGLIAGPLVVFSCLFIERVLKVDDPCGAVSVHCTNGIWGTIACGLFNAEGVLGTAASSTGLFYGGGVHQLLVQLLGVGVTAAWAFGLGLIMFYAIKKTIGVRVSRDEELKGLDLAEHNNDGYAGFQIFITE